MDTIPSMVCILFDLSKYAEIITTGKVVVKRPDAQELLAIRDGAWTYEQLIEWSDTQEEQLKELYKTCNVLPIVPDVGKLEELCIKIISEFLEQM